MNLQFGVNVQLPVLAKDLQAPWRRQSSKISSSLLLRLCPEWPSEPDRVSLTRARPRELDCVRPRDVERLPPRRVEALRDGVRERLRLRMPALAEAERARFGFLPPRRT